MMQLAFDQACLVLAEDSLSHGNDHVRIGACSVP